MSQVLLTEKYKDQIAGILHCYDRVLISGNVHPWSYPKGLTSYLYRQQIRIFDYPQFAKGLRDQLRENAQTIAADHGLAIEHIRSAKQFRKEVRISEILSQRGQQPGLVHIFSSMEICNIYQPWHNKETGFTYVRPSSTKCLYYYFYFIDPELGLCHLRVPTYCPFRLQFYFNGHNWLAHQLDQHQIGYELLDNAFVQIDDFARANQLAAEFDVSLLHTKLNAFAQLYCPVVADADLAYHWTIQQAEFATDLVFQDPSTVPAFYPLLLETLTQTVKPTDIATFFNKKLAPNYQGELGNRFKEDWHGSRVKHRMGPVSIKMYDKFFRLLRLETTVVNVSFFRQYRTVHHRDGSTSKQSAIMKKTIYNLPALQENLQAANQRYLLFISHIETAEVGVEKLHRLAETKSDPDHRYKGFNLFQEEDSFLFQTLLRGEFNISGFTNKALRPLLDKNSGQVTRLLKRLRVHRLIKKVARRNKYYLTLFGRQVPAMALKLRQLVVIPGLAQPPSAQL